MENQTIREKEDRILEIYFEINSSYSCIKTSNIEIGRLQQTIVGQFERIQEYEKEISKLRNEIRELKTESP